jgi:hypothetical protein
VFIGVHPWFFKFSLKNAVARTKHTNDTKSKKTIAGQGVRLAGEVGSKCVNPTDRLNLAGRNWTLLLIGRAIAL